MHKSDFFISLDCGFPYGRSLFRDSPSELVVENDCSVVLNNRSENCGIVGIVGDEDAVGFLLEGLTILRNRGYDSAGVASVGANGDESTLTVTKFASRDSTCDSIDLVRSGAAKHVGHGTGIGHTRWATHGGKTDANAHPHTDNKSRVAVIHNGTINNSYDLKKELQAMGIKFASETDTEVIAQLIGLYLDKGMDTKDAVVHALKRWWRWLVVL
jgi:glucosamine--fructose-6-phosphate aminotransferase (isomerizing)